MLRMHSHASLLRMYTAQHSMLFAGRQAWCYAKTLPAPEHVSARIELPLWVMLPYSCLSTKHLVAAIRPGVTIQHRHTVLGM